MSGAKIFQTILTDFRLWILIFFLIRLIGITNPPLETGHNWRQSLTNMIARNFQHNANILYPEVDYTGSNPGVIASEFPIFNYLIYLNSEIFGFEHWYGRLINLIISSIGVYFFYLLVRRITNERIAFIAGIVLLSSIWFAFSRKIMPDTFSVSLVIAGLYCGYTYLFSGSKSRLLLFFLLASLGILSKISALYLLSILALLFFVKEIPLSRKLGVLVVGGLIMGVVSLWYFYWVPYLLTTYHNQLYFPRGFVEGFKDIAEAPSGFFKNFYFNALHSYIGFIACLAGVYFVLSDSKRYLKIGMALLTFSFLAFVLKTGWVFPLHNYYIIPFVPAMALLAGIAIDRLPGKMIFLLLPVIVIEGIVNQQHDFFIRDEQKRKMVLEFIAEKYIPRNDFIVINGGPSPQDIYFANRKGWTVTNEQLNTASLKGYTQAGAMYLIVDKLSFPEELNYLPSVGKSGDYSVYRLSSGLVE